MDTVKNSALKLLHDLPEDCTWDDVMEQIYVRQKIETGLKDADEGRVVDHEQVFNDPDHAQTVDSRR